MSILSTIQALQICIESIEKREDIPKKTKTEAIEHVKRLMGRDWYIQWDKESIIKALTDYKERTGKAPTVTNLTETGMPKSLTIQSHFHMKASLLLKQLFPENRTASESSKKRNNPYGFETEGQWVCCFRGQFNKHINEGMCCKAYDHLRDKGTPTWSTIARHCGTSSWERLMEIADVRYTKPVCRTASHVYINSSTSPTMERLENINKKRESLNKELYDILSKKQKP